MPTLMEKVSEKVNEIDEYSKNSYLDHTIRSVEEYIISQNKEKGVSRCYRITKRSTQKPYLSRGQGRSYIFEYGTIIKYSCKGSGIDKRFAIAHELGHIVLHYEAEAMGGYTGTIKDPLRETEASYFAKIVINSRNDLVKRYNKLDVGRIKDYCDYYDEELLKDE